jgi:hypothetical protein
VSLRNGTGDRVTNSVFRQAFLDLSLENTTLVQGNQFSGNQGAGFEDILAFGSTGTTIRNNTLVVNTTVEAIEIATDGSNASANIATNGIDTEGNGIGLLTVQDGGGSLSVSVSGNDFVRNLTGISINGDDTSSSTAFGTVDLGGGSLGSLGGNDFHGFTGNSGGFAIQENNAGTSNSDTILAQQNVFSVSDPNTVVDAPDATVDVSNPQLTAVGFVQTVYTNYLHRAGSVPEVTQWAPLLGPIGQTGVVASIRKTTEAENVLVAGLYQQLLGRAEVGNEGAGWVTMFQQGATEEQVASLFLSSPEFARRANTLSGVNTNSSNDNYVQALYQVVLGRSASVGDVDSWLPSVVGSGRQAVALAFLKSPEFRGDLVNAMYFTAPTIRGTVPLAALLPDLLHRSVAPSAAEVNGWVKSGPDILNMENQIAGTPEAFTNG